MTPFSPPLLSNNTSTRRIEREYSRASGRPHFANLPGGVYTYISAYCWNSTTQKDGIWECCMSLNNHQCHLCFLWGCKRGQIPNPELNHHGPLSKPGNPKSQVLAETHPPSFNCFGAVFCFPLKWRTSCWEKPCFCCKRMEGHVPPIWTYKEPNKSNPTFVHAL